MSARILIIALCGVVAIGGVGAALADDGDEQIGSLDPVDLRKDDSLGDAELVDDEPNDDPTGDGDKTRGDDGTSWGHNNDHDSTAGHDGTGGGDNTDGDNTWGDDGTNWGHNNDHDSTGGHDGTSGGNNSEYVAPAPAPAPAPVYDDYSDDGGVAYSGS
jgi:hypothetical protein